MGLNAEGRVISGGISLLLAVIILSLLVAVVVLVYLLLRREKALQLVKFTLSSTGLTLALELNRDKKLELLALENSALRQEIAVLKGESIRMQIAAFFLLILMLLFSLTNRGAIGAGRAR